MAAAGRVGGNRPAEGAPVVVIGAGIMGAATAYHLARAGRPVRLLEARGILSGGAASQACAGGVRHQARGAREMPLAIDAIADWLELEADLEADIGYRREGMTIITDDPARVAELEGRVTREQAQGLKIEMVYGRDLRALIPGLTPAALAGAYCPLDGYADPLRTVSALIRAACRHGAALDLHCPALGFGVRGDRIQSVRTPRGEIRCSQVVLTAGAWTAALAASVGLKLPFQAQGLQMMVTPRYRGELTQVLGWLGQGISLKQVPSGGFVIGGGWPGDVDLETNGTRPLPGSMAKSARVAASLFPRLASASLLRAWVGIEAFSPDGFQVIGPHPELVNLCLAAGFSGHGFALGPGVGRLIARYILTGELSALLAPFAPARFAGKEAAK